MKKLLFLFVSICIFTSCSDDDDASVEGNILGTWLLVEANNVPGFTVNSCTGQSTITFNADNSASSTFYSEVDGNCVSDTDSGSWSKTSDTGYIIEVPGFSDPIAGTVIFNSDSRFTFTPDGFPTTNFVFAKN